MSRSYQKNPAGKICNCKPGIQKRWKRHMSRRRRVAERDPRFLLRGWTLFDKSNDPWGSPSDGSRWYGEEKPDRDDWIREEILNQISLLADPRRMG